MRKDWFLCFFRMHYFDELCDDNCLNSGTCAAGQLHKQIHKFNLKSKKRLAIQCLKNHCAVSAFSWVTTVPMVHHVVNRVSPWMCLSVFIRPRAVWQHTIARDHLHRDKEKRMK